MAVGVVVPLVIGWACGHLDLGAFAALGALSAGAASLRGVARTRVLAVAVASLGMALSTFIGATIAAADLWLLVPAVIGFGYIAGLAVSLGPTVSVAVLQWSVALLVAVGLPLPPREAAARAALVLAGGLLQGVLVACSWAVRAGIGERVAVAHSYTALASYAGDVAAGAVHPPAPTAFAATGALEDPNPLLPGQAHVILLDMLEQAERLRASLAALAGRAEAADDQHIRRVAGEVSAVLRLVAAALAGNPHERAAAVDAVIGRSRGLAIPTAAPWRSTGEALLGQLHTIAADLNRLEPRRTRIAARARARAALPRPPVAAAQSLPVLRASLSLSSEVGRHALRLAVVAGFAAALVLAAGAKDGRWVVLTIFLVLKPDYGTTLSRAPQRAVGTFVGAGVGVAAVHLGQLGPGALVLAVGLTVALGYAAFDVSYLVFSMCLTAFLVVVLEILGTPAVPTAEARLVDTAIGSAIALAAYLAWPTWEGLGAQEKFARVLETHRDYSTALLRALGDPIRADLARLRTLQGTARRARDAAAASAARLQDERPHPPLTPAVARALMARFSRLAHAELALHALLLGPPQPDARVGALADAVGDVMTELAVSLRTLRRLGAGPGAPRRPSGAAGRRQSAAAADGLVDAIRSIESTLHEQLLAGVDHVSKRD